MNQPTGSDRLKQSLNRLTKRKSKPHEPITLQPTTPIEAAILERLNAVAEDVQDLKDTNRWITRLAGGAIITALLDLVIK